MKQIEADKALFDNGLGLSCIENYLLYILTYLNYDYRAIYAKSYIAISGIARAFCDEKITYAYFNKIPRLQNISCDLGIARLTHKKSFQDIQACNSYCCIRVNCNFIAERYARELWRGDHYILLCKNHNDTYLLLNDIPREVMEINAQKLISIYDGDVICFDVLMESISNEIKSKLLNEFRASLSQINSACVYVFDNLETARDVLGVVRVTRKRIKEYCSIYFDTDFMSDHIAKIDKIYTMFEYMRLRNRVDYDKVNQSFSEIQESDFRVIDRLKQEMRDF